MLPPVDGRDTIADMSTPSPYDAVLAAPFGALGVHVAAEQLSSLTFCKPGTALVAPGTPFLERVARELDAYYADPAHPVQLPLAPIGSAFRMRVWEVLRTLQPGQVTTYGELARQIGSSARAVGQALGDNPLPIVIPCHRVVAAHGLGGFNHAGDGYSLDVKRWLLRHEGVL